MFGIERERESRLVLGLGRGLVLVCAALGLGLETGLGKPGETGVAPNETSNNEGKGKDADWPTCRGDLISLERL